MFTIPEHYRQTDGWMDRQLALAILRSARLCVVKTEIASPETHEISPTNF